MSSASVAVITRGTLKTGSDPALKHGLVVATFGASRPVSRGRERSSGAVRERYSNRATLR
jgi:hypothetical protein